MKRNRAIDAAFGWSGLTPSRLVAFGWSGSTPSRLVAAPLPAPAELRQSRGSATRPSQRLEVKPLHRGKHQPSRGFSLIEVIAAVVIFAIGMVAVLGLFAPVTKSVAAVGEAEAAAKVADAVRARLRVLPFASAVALVQEVAAVRRNDGLGTYNPNDGRNPAVMFAKVGGEVGILSLQNNRPVWLDSSVPTPLPVADADKYFEIELIRNDSLSPKSGDATAAMVAYTMRVRWPAFLPAASGAAVQVGASGTGAVPFDHSRKQVVFFSGAIMR